MNKSNILNGIVDWILPSAPHTWGSSAERSISETSKEADLPRRDWILLPALSLLTICSLAVSTELIALRIFPAKGDMKNCLVWNDRSSGVRGIPNCVCREKFPEGQWVEYRFNACGDYTDIECGPRSPSIYRIVMTGTSFPVGLGVARERTFAALLPKELSRRTGRKVELYNDSLPRKSPRVIALRFNELLAAKPDLILWALNYSDIQIASIVAPSDYVDENAWSRASKKAAAGPDTSPVFHALLSFRGKAELDILSFEHEVNNAWRDARSYVMLTDFMAANESQSQFLKRNRTSESQYLDAEPSQGRLNHLKEFDRYVADIEGRAAAAGVPLVAVLLPTRLSAAMISSGEWPADIDPFKLDEQLRSIIVSHGGTYIDILPDFRTIPNPEQGYFPADGHFNPEGHAMISDLLAKELTSGAVPALEVSAHSQAQSVQRK
jgi:hypothetical protein